MNWPCPACGATDFEDAGDKCGADWVCAADEEREGRGEGLRAEVFYGSGDSGPTAAILVSEEDVKRGATSAPREAVALFPGGRGTASTRSFALALRRPPYEINGREWVAANHEAGGIKCK